MSDEYQFRKDIDKLKQFTDKLEYEISKRGNSANIEQLLQYYDNSINDLYTKLGFSKTENNKFKFEAVNRVINDVTYEEFWILSNAHYDYDAKRFVKIDGSNTSFGIQIQASGTYPGEAELGYMGNVGINIWRNPSKATFEETFPNWETDPIYDFSDFMNNSHIGLKIRGSGEWKEYGYFSGWTNSFMIDSYGGMTIGGAGFEIDGNGIFPYTRLTSSRYTDENDNVFHLLGLLDNAYHPTKDGWECDDNSTYSWFIGLRTPESSDLIKDNVHASFVVMYNDTPYNGNNNHELDVGRWHIVFEVNTNGMV